MSRGGGIAGARVLAEQEQQLAGARELRRIAETAAAPVEGLLELRDAVSSQRAGVGTAPPARAISDAVELRRRSRRPS